MVNAVAAAVLVAGVIAVAGAVVTIIQLVRRAPGWPFAIATLLMCGITLVAGGFGDTAAVTDAPLFDGDRSGQVARLVDVRSRGRGATAGGEHLQRDGRQEWLEKR